MNGGPWLRVRVKNKFPATSYSGIGERQLRQLIKTGQLRAVRLAPGGALVIHREWLDNYLLSHEVGAQADQLVSQALRKLEDDK